MPTMTVSVHLPGDASSEDHGKLRKQMEAGGFRRTIRDKNNCMWLLPDGAYRYTASPNASHLSRPSRFAAVSRIATHLDLHVARIDALGSPRWQKEQT